MVGLALPNFIFGHSVFEEAVINHNEHYIKEMICDPTRNPMNNSTWLHPVCNSAAHSGAYAILAVSQFIAGVAAAPFNTLAYVYIDDNVSYRQSPFLLGKHWGRILCRLTWGYVIFQYGYGVMHEAFSSDDIKCYFSSQ